ncbi:DUF5806 family protein [Halopiger goleimassiliensis]|uniref:DUF5806 family protein n=1 Tax=Halopiger goleimassiliensis TaxID=1293048 RepID=UPI000677D402|nr:DUF5806 family protein [Halopiger goleimassiliensis]
MNDDGVDGIERDESPEASSEAGDAEMDGAGTGAVETDESDDETAPGTTPDAGETQPETNVDTDESDSETAADAESESAAAETDADDDGPMPNVPDPEAEDSDVPEDVRKYARFKKMDGAEYERVNEFLRDRTYITAREWAIARLCSDFRTETGVEMTKIGENLPELVPFMTDTYTPQAVNQARASFEEKVRKAGATFLYGAMCDFFTAEELDDVMYESTEVAKFLLEVEGVDLSVEEELEAEERISSVMREVREASEQLREEDLE